MLKDIVFYQQLPQIMTVIFYQMSQDRNSEGVCKWELQLSKIRHKDFRPDFVRQAQGTPPEIRNGVDWRALVKSRAHNICSKAAFLERVE